MNEQEKIIEFSKKYPVQFKYTISERSESFSLNLDFIEKYRNKFDWNVLSANKYIPWTTEFIRKNKSCFDWFSLSNNESLPLSYEFIEEFSEKFNNDGCITNLFYNPGIKWDFILLEKIEKLFSKAPLKYLGKYLLQKKQKILINLIRIEKDLEIYQNKFENKIDEWHWLSSSEKFTWTLEFIEKYKNELLWEALSKNESLPWSEKLIDKYSDKWNWYCLCKVMECT